MEYEWDDEKNRANVKKHSLDFRDVPEIFMGRVVTVVDDRMDYGEERLITLGVLRDVVVVIVHTYRKDKNRIISLRKASPRERKFYEENLL